MKYRNSTEIIGTILELAQEEAPMCKLLQANIPHKRLKYYLNKLIDSNMIMMFNGSGRSSWVITENGRICLDKYKKLYEFAESFGLEL